MKKQELQELVRKEINSIVKLELKKMIKPLVQEAVAGALASILAEGIVKNSNSNNKILRPGIPQARTNTEVVKKTGLTASARRSMAEKMGYGHIEKLTPSGIEKAPSSVQDILNEVAERSGDGTVSILDNIDEENVSSDAVNAITRNYSDVMDKLRLGKK